MAGRDEQETSITAGRLDDYVEIWSNNTVDVRALEKESRAKRIVPNPDRINGEALADYMEQGWGVTYRVSTDDFHPLKGFRRKRKPMTDEEKAAVSARLAAGRAS